MILLGILAALVIASAAGYWWRVQRERGRRPSKRGAGRNAGGLSPSRKRGKDSESTGRRFASVEIRVTSSACSAARTLEGRALFASEAPALPLDGCTEARCRCSFGKLSDRRQDKRRLMDEGIGSTLFSAAEKRAGDDRRDSDSQR